MSKQESSLREKISIFSLVAVLLLLVVLFGVVFYSDDPQWFVARLGMSRGHSEKYESLKFLGLGMGGILLVLQALASYKRAKALEDSVWSTEQGQRQEQLKNAIEHLGHDKESVRLGGAYELFHLAEETQNWRQTILDILCAHIRRTTGEGEYKKEEKYKSKPSEEIQSLLTLLFVQKHEVFKCLDINLRGSWLNGSILRGARLEKAILTGAYLQRVDFEKAQLQGADLENVKLQEAVLGWAELREARLRGAQLQGASLESARLERAMLKEAQLQGANLRGADLYEARLWRAQLQGAVLKETRLREAFIEKAQLQGADLESATLERAVLKETRLQGITSQKMPFFTFAERIRGRVGKAGDTSGVIFEDKLIPEVLDSLGEDSSVGQATDGPDQSTPRFRRVVSHKLPENSGAITGAYTTEEAEQWIAEYNEAMSEVPEESDN